MGSSSLDQLKNFTVIVADTGDFDGNLKFNILTWKN